MFKRSWRPHSASSGFLFFRQTCETAQALLLRVMGRGRVGAFEGTKGEGSPGPFPCLSVTGRKAREASWLSAGPRDWALGSRGRRSVLMGSRESGEKRFFQPGPSPGIRPSCFRSGNQAELLPQASFPRPAHACRGPAPHWGRQVGHPMAGPRLPHPSGQAGSWV